MKYLLVIVSAILFMGCGEESTSEEGSQPQSIIGNWKSSCYHSYYSPDPEDIWSVAEYNITATTITNTYTNYSDNTCTQPYAGGVALWEGYSGTYIHLRNVTTLFGNSAVWHEVNVTSPSNFLVESGLYANTNELRLVVEDQGDYLTAIMPVYYKQ